MVKVCQHVLVTGKVQGVWYRDSAKKMAESLGITGWVRNLPTGQVEAVACGDDEIVTQLCEWFWSGPPAAEVQDVRCTEHAWDEYNTFEIR